MTILLSGHTGFVGQVLVEALNTKKLVLVGRRKFDIQSYAFFQITFDAIEQFTECLSGVSVVIHLAARAHIMNDEVSDPLAEYRKVNVDGTLNLARQAAATGVKRFIYLSSIKVNGESTTGRSAFFDTDMPAPEDPYGLSKKEAEDGLRQLSTETGMEVVIIRPPLVYGPGVKANFLNLLKLSTTGLPLPFGLVNNRRSTIYVGNLVDFIIRCIDHPNAANETFLVSDGEDLSLRLLITHIRSALGRSALLLPVPLFMFKLVAALTGKRAVVDRLIGDLQVDSSKARDLLNWTPPYSVKQGIAATVADFIKRKS